MRTRNIVIREVEVKKRGSGDSEKNNERGGGKEKEKKTR